MRRLIINADDFGMTRGINRGIIEAHTRGVVTSSTLMACAEAFDDAISLLANAPRLSVGCHVILVDGNPASAPETIPCLVEGSAFRHKLVPFISAALRRKLREEEVAAEIAAQIRRLQSTGLTVTHVDTHKHTHMFPAVLRPLLQAAKECGVGAVRNPFVPLRPLAFAHLMKRPKLWTRYSETRLLRKFAAQFRRAVADAGMKTTDGSFGIVTTGTWDKKLFAAVMGCIPEGTWELVCHPGYSDAALEAIRTRLRKSRVAELEILTSPDARQILDTHGIELISYRDLL